MARNDGVLLVLCSGSMSIQPWWGSSTSSLFAMIENAPTTIRKFEIKGAAQSDDAYQQCVFQNVNAFQCTLPSPLTEPASVRLNDGDFVGVEIIESMTGSAAKYPLDSCSSSSAFLAEAVGGHSNGNGNGLNFWAWTALSVGALVCVMSTVAFAMWRWRSRKLNGKVSFEETEDREQAVEETEIQSESTVMTVGMEVDGQHHL